MMLGGHEVDALDTLLLSYSNEDGMLFSKVDGFCAGFTVCPEIVIPVEWLSCVLGDSTEHWGPLKGVQRVTGMLTRD